MVKRAESICTVLWYKYIFFKSVADNLGLQYLVLSREREDAFPMYFEEMMAGNWSGGYYSHLWSKMLAADIFSAYWEAGWDDPKAGLYFLQNDIHHHLSF